MKKSLLSVFVFLLYYIAPAHNASIEGIVMSSYNSTPMKGVSVTLKGTDYKTITDDKGQFHFLEIPARDYTVVVTSKGYYTFERLVDLKPDQTFNLSVYVYPELITLPEVSTSNNFSRSTQAASSEILSGFDLLLRPRNTAQDMLTLVPGLFVAQHAGGGKAEQIFVRGYDCDHGTDVAVFVDDMPINMPTHGHGQGFADLHFLIPETVDKMEVNKGPFNVQYGDFATAAAVKFKTFDTLPRNFVTLEATSTPTQRTFSGSRFIVGANIPTGTSKVSSYIAGEYSYTPGYFDVNQKFSRFNLFGKIKANISNSTSLTFTASGFGGTWNAPGQIPERALTEGLIDRFGSLDKSEGGTTQRENFVLALHNYHDNHTLDLSVYYVKYRFKLFSNFTFFAVDSVNGDEIEQNDNRNIIGATGKYGIYENIGKVSTKTTIGLGYRADDIENSIWHVVQRNRLNVLQQGHTFENAMNLWLKQDFEFTDWFHADIGLRFDYFIFDVNDELPTDSVHTNYSGFNFQVLPSYKLNLVFRPAKNLQLFVNNGIGFHSNDARVLVQQPDNHFLPMVFATEVGAQLNVASRALFTASLWMQDSKDELTWDGDAGTTSINGPARRMGIDFSTRIQIRKWLFFDADVTPSRSFYTDKFLGTKLPTDYHLPLAPTFTSAGGFTVRHKSGFTARLGYKAVTNHPANESYTLTAKGYFLLDAAAGFEQKHWAINLSVVNILNSKWNEAQFETTSRLKGEEAPVEELNFTPGTPMAIKLGFSAFF